MGRNWQALALLALGAVSGCSGDAETEAAGEVAATAPRPQAVAGANAAVPKSAGPEDTLDLNRVPEVDIGRETFIYQAAARDPFSSLIAGKTSGPELVDLQLVAIYENLQSPSNSVIVMREKVGEKRHKLRIGDRMGRMQLLQIRPREAVFTVFDLGSERQETLSLPKQEDVTP